MLRRATPLLLLAASASLGACEQQPATDLDRPATSREFPRAVRPVSELGGNSVSTEQARDDRNEASTVMDLAQIEPGMTVADIGAGEGYYTVRLAERVGGDGRVLAQDIDQDALRRLGSRVEDERLDNVSIQLGEGRVPLGGICSQAGTRGLLCAVCSGRPAAGTGRNRSLQRAGQQQGNGVQIGRL